MKEVCHRLKQYLDNIGFTQIYKYIVSPVFYNLSPYIITEGNLAENKIINKFLDNRDINLIKILLFLEEVDCDTLSSNEMDILIDLKKLNIVDIIDNKIVNQGYQLVSYEDMYILIDAKINFPSKGVHDVYIGFDTYNMLYYVNSQKINRKMNGLDLCTGSGVSAIYLSKFLDNVDATDISDEALKIAEFNIYLNAKDKVIRLLREDLKDTIDNRKKYDIITCNPPFVAFPEEVRGPMYAKGHSEDGLGLYRKLFSKVSDILSDEGTAYFVGDYAGDENNAYFLEELKEYSNKYKLDIDFIIENKLDANVQKESFPHMLKKYNTDMKEEDLRRICAKFFDETLNAKFYYLSTIIIKKANSNPKFNIFNKFL